MYRQATSREAQLAELATDPHVQVAAVGAISKSTITIRVQDPVAPGTFVRLRANDCLVLGVVVSCVNVVQGWSLQVEADEIIPFRPAQAAGF